MSRSPDCDHYSICLDLAASKNTNFTCSGCHRYLSGPCHDTMSDLAGSLRLILALFHPTLYRALAIRPGLPRLILKHWIDVHAPDANSYLLETWE